MVSQFISIVLVGVFALQSSPVIALDPPPFPDMDGSWYLYREAVNALREKNIISGYPDNTFRPKQTINRAEFLKLVFIAKEGDSAIDASCFTDVPDNAWFAPFVCAAKRRGIAKGYPDGSFKPEQEVNWAEAVALAERAYGWDVTERTGERWYLPFTQALDEKKVLRESSYVPWTPLTRERAADLIHRMLEFEEGNTMNASTGCRSNDTKVATTFTVNGQERSFLITIPQSAKRNDPTPLLIAFHGRTNSNERVQSYMRFEREAADMIVVYPAGMPNKGGYTWANNTGPDTAFFDALVDHIGDSVCVDMDRIYVTGHSLGAWMANSIACLRGGVVRASGTVGGEGLSKKCTGPSAAFIANNPTDTLSSRALVERVRADRVAINACSWDLKEAAPRSLLCVRHQSCPNGNDVLWCPHRVDTDERGDLYPHTWPRGTAKSMVEFFRGLDE